MRNAVTKDGLARVYEGAIYPSFIDTGLLTQYNGASIIIAVHCMKPSQLPGYQDLIKGGLELGVAASVEQYPNLVTFDRYLPNLVRAPDRTKSDIQHAIVKTLDDEPEWHWGRTVNHPPHEYYVLFRAAPTQLRKLVPEAQETGVSLFYNP